ncbi:hypothetical protein QEG73_24665 [Chitinophagaceae bacterium 26-R-25]|nr:hypothetical protein [Chitinophagaceae bacterium 26-R-25]
MKTNRKYFILIIMALSVFAACKKDDNSAPNYNADKSELNKLIDSATNVYNSAVEGKQAGQYAVGSKADLNETIDLAKQVSTGNTYTQQQVDNSVANFERSLTAFYSRQIQDVSVENLMAYWKFSGNAGDSSGNGNDGMLKSGIIGATPVDGGVLPQLTSDRYGNANMAYKFDNGAYIEIPYKASLNPKSFTISLWVKRGETFSDNYMVSLDRWNGFKFQLQSNNFLFLTLSKDNGINDVDSNPASIPQDDWTQAAVSYTNGSMKFYVNGDLKRTVAITGTPITLPTPINLCIGQQLPKDKFSFTDTADPNYYWGPSYFKGSLDDIRFYNKALSDAEVLSIYTMESYK